ncbi:DUF3224 domain-containing protein [Chromobacterium rhizoryzae]|uniref:DUF3224 domain-containing protein n=1 Tax=Chromobacterium rhizoryzae TaxID=1778675 RepID=UPI001967D680|nr:DUF3224 domain-containing protein [Chromobacterium rhizoryzae]
MADKRFHGDLDAVSQGEMLSFRSAEPGSAGYVAMERVQGNLHGRKGGFVLQHSATMMRGAAEQAIMVTPDSGTGELSGISGRLRITITAGEHFYDFDYTLPGQAVQSRLRTGSQDFELVARIWRGPFFPSRQLLHVKVFASAFRVECPHR